MRIAGNQLKSMEIYEIHEHVSDVFVLKKRRWVIFCILRVSAPHIFVSQREINCLNRENENLGFRENLDCDLQITYQSHYFYENLKWSRGQYAHFAPSGFPSNPDRSSVLNKRVESIFFKKYGTHFRPNIWQFDVNPAAISMNFRSGPEWNGPRDPEIN